MPQRDTSKLSTWRRLYIGVAAFNILTVLLSAWFGSRVLTDYRDSVTMSALWTDRLETLTVLGELAASVEIAGNEALRSRRVESARARINSAATRFQTVMDSCAAGWSADRDPTLVFQLRPGMARIESGMARLTAEAERLVRLSPSARDQTELTLALHAAHNDLAGAIANLRAQIRAHVDGFLHAQLASSERFAPITYAICIAVLITVCAAMWYGRRLSIAIAAAEDQIRANLDAAHAASRAKSDFLANMSHEIRSPMTAILGYAELLENPAQHDWKDCVATIRRNGEHLTAVINDILDLSKVEAGKMTVESLDCSPVELVQEVHALMGPRFRAKGLTLDIRHQFPLPRTIRTDPIRFRQVLINLLGNALKFTEKGGAAVTVSLDRLPSGARILRFEVADTGIGIAPENLARLFQPFTQSDTSTTRRFGGTGLGLSISRRLARLLGGDLTATSTPGEGSTFTATIQVGTLEGVAMAERLDDALPAPSSGGITLAAAVHANILLAEDGEDNRRLLTHFLQTAGATVEHAENGRTAVERVLGAGPDIHLILMDMQMPEMDGYTAARTLRQRGVKLPIIALTANAMAGERERCLEAGCDDYLTKPIPRRALVEACRRWVETARRAAA
ncbi:MAG: ATP-binding protein [Phycisphaerales bacterium]